MQLTLHTTVSVPVRVVPVLHDDGTHPSCFSLTLTCRIDPPRQSNYNTVSSVLQRRSEILIINPIVRWTAQHIKTGGHLYFTQS